MRNILAKELKIKFIEILNGIDGFSYEDGNPFLIKIGTKRFFIFLKNLSPAYFKNSPDVTRVQLPYSSHFGKIFKANIPFIILGYDVDKDKGKAAEALVYNIIKYYYKKSNSNAVVGDIILVFSYITNHFQLSNTLK